MIRLASRHLEAQGVEMHQDVNVAGSISGGSYFVCVASYSRHPYVDPVSFNNAAPTVL